VTLYSGPELDESAKTRRTLKVCMMLHAMVHCTRQLPLCLRMRTTGQITMIPCQAAPLQAMQKPQGWASLRYITEMQKSPSSCYQSHRSMTFTEQTCHVSDCLGPSHQSIRRTAAVYLQISRTCQTRIYSTTMHTSMSDNTSITCLSLQSCSHNHRTASSCVTQCISNETAWRSSAVTQSDA
jgi:hypothetical protein